MKSTQQFLHLLECIIRYLVVTNMSIIISHKVSALAYLRPELKLSGRSSKAVSMNDRQDVCRAWLLYQTLAGRIT